MSKTRKPCSFLGPKRGEMASANIGPGRNPRSNRAQLSREEGTMMFAIAISLVVLLVGADLYALPRTGRRSA